ncbi:MAG: hypothetical protein IRY91_15000 [Gemmatimonadaceae bacterium]|nr:hypothetical protein [Gemmatimonadaceae bacterium]
MRILALLPSGTAASLQRHLHAEHCVHVMRRADVDLVVLDPELIDDARAAVSMREMLESWGGAVIVYTSLMHRALHATFRMLGHTSLALVLHG